MALKTGHPTVTNGSGKRKLDSWIESFVESTEHLAAPKIFRRWSAISTIAAVLEQKVWVNTGSALYPNLYVLLVAPPGIGKSRSIKTSTSIMREMTNPFIAPTSMTMAAMVDEMVKCKRVIINHPEPAYEYNTMYITADEMSAFMHDYNNELIAGLTTFYDSDVPYGQARRLKDLRVVIKRPQLNILCGTTPVKLTSFIPETAWGDGFTSRIIMVYSNEHILRNIFQSTQAEISNDLLHDLTIINASFGQFGWTQEYADVMHKWKEMGFPPKPNHPRLEHYNTRREAHVLKLSMIAAIDTSSKLELTKAAFDKAYNWLMEAETYMERIFQTGSSSEDSAVMDEVLHFIQSAGDKGMKETQVMNFVRMHIKHAYNAKNIVPLMEQSGMIKVQSVDKLGLRTFSATAS